MSLAGALLFALAVCLMLPTVAGLAREATPCIVAALVIVGIWRLALPPRPRRR